ncbi:hypothetical protein P6144_00165 [Sphingomonas sp. HITSZ_GF]|uniref:hypothetical protein n=1 Tax=Sphingomonas sp. HITSZ_GF TaxID=3037247 RepID=UPI00240D3CC9|nr:hypothetical protein [Sphingomonas sp. HITSZ_GF]MDG2532049.1 hypothetical protein [Sphingomonas sp. HITSZ_GF]
MPGWKLFLVIVAAILTANLITSVVSALVWGAFEKGFVRVETTEQNIPPISR